MTLLTGTAEEKAIQCLEKAGWYPGRKTDITEVESYYSGKGITLTEPQKDIFREFYGIAEGWYLYDQEDMVMPETDLSGTHPDFEFYLLPGKYPRIYSRSAPESIYSTDIPEGSYYNDQIKKLNKDRAARSCILDVSGITIRLSALPSLTAGCGAYQMQAGGSVIMTV